ncbi:MAG: dephospho-CoA kinase [Notoacmeibacter sp.]|nr:dephospho-CoA kinase [Notoacmeibacter sp.]
MIIIGLTGSIGMGKSTVAGMFADAGIPVHDADKTVHRLYSGRAVPLIETAFPGTTANGAVDRQKLAAAVLGDAAALKRLEAIVHPLVREDEQAFLKTARESGAAIAILDIPLLFETGGSSRVDKTVVVSAPPEAQRERVLARPGMTVEKFAAILSKQMPDAEKRARAHFVVDTGGTFEETRRQVGEIIAALSGENRH